MTKRAEYKKIVSKISIPANHKIKQKAYLQSGTLPVIDQGQELVGGYTNDCQKQIVCDLPVIVFGDHTKNVKYINFPFCAGADGIKILKAKDDVFPKYLYYGTIFLTYCIEDKGYARHYQHIEKYDLLVPPLPEQERIVAKIEELFSQLDAAVAELKSVKEKLSIYRQAVLKEAFEGKLTEKWRILHHKNNEWCVFNIKNIVQKGQNSLKAGPFGSALKKSCYVPSGYKVYGQEQVIAGNENIGDYYISEEKYQELISCKIQPYDILISLVGTVGKVLILSAECEPGVINPRLIKVSLDRKKMLPEFFKYYFTSNYLKSLYKQKVHGATMDVLNMGMIKELPFQWCPIDEQRQVMSEIEARISICNNIEQTVDTALQRAAALRQSILKQAFEGNL